jgi:hypothetical protein
LVIEYINRKCQKYYLHQGATKTGKPKYFFSMKNKGTSVKTVPDGCLNHSKMRIKKNALLVEDGENKQWYRLRPSHGFKDYHDKPRRSFKPSVQAPVKIVLI